MNANLRPVSAPTVALIKELIESDKENTASTYAGDSEGLDRFLSAMHYLEVNLGLAIDPRCRISKAIAAELRSWCHEKERTGNATKAELETAIAFITSLWSRRYSAHELILYQDRPRGKKAGNQVGIKRGQPFHWGF